MTLDLHSMPARFEADRLTIDPAATLEDVEKILAFIGRVDNASRWWLGDAIVDGEDIFGEATFSQIVEASGLPYQTVANRTWVAGRVTKDRRRPELSYSHHAEVAKLGPVEQVRLLDEAVQKKLSVRIVRELATASAVSSAPAPASPENASGEPTQASERDVLAQILALADDGARMHSCTSCTQIRGLVIRDA